MSLIMTTEISHTVTHTQLPASIFSSPDVLVELAVAVAIDVVVSIL